MSSHDLDYLIIRLLCKNGRASNRQLAKELGVSETTVSKRVKLLLNKERIHIVAYPNRMMLRAGVTGNLRVKIEPGRAPEISQELSEIKALWYVAQTVGPDDFDCEFFLSSQDGIGSLREQLELMEGVISFDISLLTRYLKNYMGFGFPETPDESEGNGNLKESDYQIQRILCKDGRTSNKAIARTLGLSETTIRTRVNMLIKKQHIHICAQPNPRYTESGILGSIRIKAGSGYRKSIGEGLNQIDAIWYIAQFWGGNDDFEVEFFVRSQKDMVVLINRLDEIDGIVQRNLSLPLKTIKHEPESIQM